MCAHFSSDLRESQDRVQAGWEEEAAPFVPHTVATLMITDADNSINSGQMHEN